MIAYANNPGETVGTTPRSRGTSHGCPPQYTRGIREVGIKRPSHVDTGTGSTLHQRVVVHNPQHLLLIVNIETSLHEEKCPL
jgi:hypothetical protein